MNKFIGFFLVALLTISLVACTSSNTSQGPVSHSDNRKSSAAYAPAATDKNVNSDSNTNTASCTFKSHNNNDK